MKDAAEFKVEEGKKIRTTDCIRYEFIPPRFIKHIYHQHYYACKGTVYAGSLPAVPLLNSNYDASFIAGIQIKIFFASGSVVPSFFQTGFYFGYDCRSFIGDRDQLKLAAQREEELLKVIADQNEQLNILTAEVKSLNSSILSLDRDLFGFLARYHLSQHVNQTMVCVVFEYEEPFMFGKKKTTGTATPVPQVSNKKKIEDCLEISPIFPKLFRSDRKSVV